MKTNMEENSMEENTEETTVENKTEDTEIDPWKITIPKFEKGEMKSHLLEESSFIVMFPKYRETYLTSAWGLVNKKMSEYGIKAELDCINGTMKVSTTKKTWDPCAILNARDIIQLIARCVPIEQAVRVFEDEITQVIINIGSMVRNKTRFVHRRQRLIGSNGTTLKALELLTDCYVVVQGRTVAAIGPHKGVYEAERVIKETMNNIHPVYLLKRLMIRRQIFMKPELQNEDWGRYLPVFKPKNVQRKKPKNLKKKGPYTPFPPEQAERKQDQEIAEGKFFFAEKTTKRKGETEERFPQEAERGPKRKIVKISRRDARRAKAFQAPVEPAFQSNSGSTQSEVDINALKKKLGRKKVFH